MSFADLVCLVEDIDHDRTLACVVHPSELTDGECPAEWNYLIFEGDA